MIETNPTWKGARLETSVLGIDIGKSDFHVTLLVDDRSWSKSFPNVTAGMAQLTAWLKNRKVQYVHACLESTGGFEEAVALDLHEIGHTVSIVNPSRIKAFAQSELLRTKTDAVDAALIARFCRAHQPEPWSPPAPEMRALQALVRRHAALQEMLRIESNRCGAPRLDALVQRSLRKHLAYLQRDLERVEREIADISIGIHRCVSSVTCSRLSLVSVDSQHHVSWARCQTSLNIAAPRRLRPLLDYRHANINLELCAAERE